MNDLAERAIVKSSLDELQRKAIALVREIDDLDREMKIRKARLNELEPVILERMLESAQARATYDGVTIGLRRELWARVLPERLNAFKNWLRRNGVRVEQIVNETANVQSVSALVREQLRAIREQLGSEAIGKSSEELLPAELQGCLAISEGQKISYRKADSASRPAR